MFFGKILLGNQPKLFEDELHCRAICRFHYEGETVGGYLLKKDEEYQVNFVFETEGIHSLQTENQIPYILTNWNEGLISLNREGLRIIQRSRSEDNKLIEKLEKKAKRLSNPTLSFLGYAQAKTVKEKIKKRKRCEYQTLLIAPYSYKKDQTGTEDFIESKVSWVLDKYGYLNGEKEQDKRKFYAKLLSDSFHKGYLIWKQTLINRFKIPEIKAMTAERTWEYVWKEFNYTEVSTIPHVIDVFLNKNGTVTLDESFGSSRSLGSTIIGGGEINPSIPYRSKQWNHWIRVKEKYVGAVVYEKELQGYASELGQLEFFWKRLKNIPESEIVMEIHPTNQKVEEFLMQRAARGNNWDIKETEKKGSKNIRAEQQNEDIYEAQRKMLENNRVCLVSIVIYLYRENNEELTQDINQLIKDFPTLCFKREWDRVDRLWLNKLPIVCERLIRRERQIKMLSEDIPLPLVIPKGFNKKGFELLTQSGNKPIHLDFKNNHLGMLSIGMTRSGKTALACDIANQNLADKIPSVIIDYGNPDGSTSYTDYTKGLGESGANLQAGIDKHNLMQIPDLSNLKPEKKATHKVASEGFIITFLETIILGEDRISKTAKRVSSLLGYAVSSFYEKPQIIKKFEFGYKKGLGSSDWQRMPTIIDFRDYVKTISNENFGVETQILEEAKQEVLWGLGTFIKSRLGQKLSQPSEVNLEADLICISMRQARGDDEMALLSLCAQSLAINKALKYPKCHLILDEGNIVGQNKTVIRNIAETIVNGAKGGIFCNVIMQNIDTLMAAGELGQVIIDNLPVKMIGLILESAITNLAKGLKIPESVLLENAGSEFMKDPINIASTWLMLANGIKTKVCHTPSPELLALVASNPQESAARKRYLEAYQDNFWQGMGIFAHDYALALQGSRSFDELVPPIFK